jgi:hypothetical protein
MKRYVAGRVVLVKHDGSSQEWTIQNSGDDDMSHITEVFETSKVLCRQELSEGGTLYLYNGDRKLLREVRGWAGAR